jgi:hypothetical protein
MSVSCTRDGVELFHTTVEPGGRSAHETFVNRNFIGPTVSYLIIYWKKPQNTMKFKRRHGRPIWTAMYWAKVTQQLALSRRYSQLVAKRCYRLACLLLETPFVTRDVFVWKICSWTICSWSEAFVNRFVRDERRSWTDFFVMRGVRGPICSWWEAFVNRGSTVLIYSTLMHG